MTAKNNLHPTTGPAVYKLDSTPSTKEPFLLFNKICQDKNGFKKHSEYKLWKEDLICSSEVNKTQSAVWLT